MTKFLVNKMTEHGGETNRMAEILHNVALIGPKYRDGFMEQVEKTNLPYIVQICVCGRFITYIEVTKNLKEGVMHFYDVKNDADLALDVATEIQNNWYGSYYFNWFMETFQQLKEVYGDNYDAAELLLVENAGLLLN